MASDPLTVIHEAAWAEFENDTATAALVAPKNRIKLTERDAIKASVQDGDLPEVVLVPRANIGNLTSTSSSVSFEITFDWLIATGDYRVGYRILPVIWNLYRVMSKFQQSASSLEFDSRKYVNGVFFNNNTVGESDAERNRGIRGFSAIMNFMVRMNFIRSTISGG